jgi:hypothetical protein
MIVLTQISATAWNAPRDPVQAQVLAARGFTLGNDRPELAALAPLKARLLGYGGWAVILPLVEQDLANLLERGILLDGAGAVIRRGEPSRCHYNVARFWGTNRRSTYDIFTGYAFSKDGLWRPHSWMINNTTTRLVETTERRVAYYGYRLNGTEAQQFFDENF